MKVARYLTLAIGLFLLGRSFLRWQPGTGSTLSAAWSATTGAGDRSSFHAIQQDPNASDNVDIALQALAGAGWVIVSLVLFGKGRRSTPRLRR